MSDGASTSIELEFADGRYTFKLGLAQINELQAKCGCGIGALYARVLKGRYTLEGLSFGHPGEADYHVADVIEPIRQGLIGGGQGEADGQPIAVTSIVANRLVASYTYPERPLSEAWTLAAAILSTAIDGYTPKKKEAEPEPKKATAGSTTRKRSQTAQ